MKWERVKERSTATQTTGEREICRDGETAAETSRETEEEEEDIAPPRSRCAAPAHSNLPAPSAHFTVRIRGNKAAAASLRSKNMKSVS